MAVNDRPVWGALPYCACILLGICATSPALACIVWDPYPGGGGISCAGITQPLADYGYACNSHVTCTIAEASDLDHRYHCQEGNSYPSDTFTYTWTATAGSFPYGNTGRTVTWRAPNAPSGGVTITCRVNDVAQIPGGETGDRDDGYEDYSVTVKVYKVRCLKVEGTNDVDIYWPDEPHYSDKLWAADTAAYENNGVLSEIWHRERIADIFRPVTQHYKLEFSFHRFPTCTTNQTLTTTVELLNSAEDVTGWSPSIWVDTRASVGRRSYKLVFTFKVGGRQVDGVQSIPGGEDSYFVDYAIYGSPVETDPEDFNVPHLHNATFWGSGGTSVTRDDLPHKIQENCWYNFLAGKWVEPWELETHAGDCASHSALIAVALKVIGISANGTMSHEDPTYKVCDESQVPDPPGVQGQRWCEECHKWEWHLFEEAAGAHVVTNYEAVTEVDLIDEDPQWECYYDKGMGAPYQYGAYDQMWYEWNSYAPPNNKVIRHFVGWENHWSP